MHDHAAVATPVAHDCGASEALLTVASLSRAVEGRARLSDVGALMWMLLRQIVPGDAMALFLFDDERDLLVVRYADGLHAPSLFGVAQPMAAGVAGRVAANRQSMLNADPALDLGFRADSAPALRSGLVTPLLDDDAIVAVLAIYSRIADAFGEHHARLLELAGPNLAAALVDAIIAEHDRDATARRPGPALKLIQRI
jgi:GAF domain-containing protein